MRRTRSWLSIVGCLGLAAAWGVLALPGGALANPPDGDGNHNHGGGGGGGGGGNGGGGNDHTPPAAITDLSVVAITHNSLTCTWTATGDDGSIGTATEYDIRFLLGEPVTESNWDSAWHAFDEPLPLPTGSAETFVLPRLRGDTSYYVALKVIDDRGNISALSNNATAATDPTPFGAWKTILVDQGEVRLHGSSLDFDPFDNHPSVIYNSDPDDQTYFRQFDGVGWTTELVVALEAYSIRMAHDFSGLPIAAFYDPSSSDLMFAERTQTGWVVETVDESNGSTSLGMAISPTGQPTVAYFAPGEKHNDPPEMRLATRTVEGWVTELIPFDFWNMISLAFDDSGNPIVVWRDKLQDGSWVMLLAQPDETGQWFEEVVWGPMESSPHDINVALDPLTGEPMISFAELFGIGGSRILRFARRVEGIWTFETIDGETGRFAQGSLAIDSFGLPAVAYTELDTDEIRLARWDGVQWNIEVVDPTTCASRLTLRFDALGNPGILIVVHQLAHSNLPPVDEVILYLK